MKSRGDLVLIALQYYGQEAIPGAENNPLVLGFFQKANHAEISSDDTPWCSAFMSAIASEAGAAKTESLAARAWLKVGEEIDSPQFGDVAIFWRDRPDGFLGHVGIVIAHIGEVLWILGGNQDNRVEIKAFSTEKVLGYRKILA